MMDPLTVTSLALAGTSAIKGIVQGNKAKKLRSQYDGMEAGIPVNDPEQVAYLGDVRRRRAAFDAGTDPLTGFVSQQARQMGAQTQANLVRRGRGGVDDLLRSQAVTDNAIGAAGASASRRADQLFQMEGQLVGAMAAKRYNESKSDANRVWSEYARAKEDSNAAVMAAIGMAPDLAVNMIGTGPRRAMRRTAATPPERMDVITPVADPLSYVPRPATPLYY